MGYFLKTYKDICKNEFGKYGFKSYRNNHYRVINDVFQSFGLHRSVYGWDCTIEFTIAPLCGETKLEKTTCGADHLKMFEGVYEWFPYDRNSEDSMKSCILDMVSYMHKYLMPYFEKGDSCKSAYNVIGEFEVVSRAKIEKQEGIKEFSLYSYIRACMALKNGDYDKAYEHFKVVEAQWLDAYKTNSETYKEKIDPEYVKRYEAKLAELREKIRRISEHDMDYINNFIWENERDSLINLGLMKNY